MQDVICEEVYNEYYDSAGNYHWTGTVSGEHIIRAEGADMNKALNEIKVNEKEKVMFPEIVVKGTKDKPYYEIKYYDVTDKQWHLGYGSYNLEYVMQWKEECLEVVEGSITNGLCEKIIAEITELAEPNGNPYIDCADVIEIINEYKNGHYGCNWNGQHEKCKDCGLRGECSHYNTEWFDVPEINVGENDEFCEWKCNAIGFIINPHTKRMFNNEPRMKNVYCNTCGKEIKVVE